MKENYLSDNQAAVPTHISDVVKPWADRSPDRPALAESDGTWTYRQLATIVRETQSWLLESGVRPGDRVMIVGENCRAFVALFLATVGVDAWPVLVNAHLSAREVDGIRDHCGARRAIYTSKVSAHAFEHAKRQGAALVELPDLGALHVSPLNDRVEPESIDTNPENCVAALIYTSGSTGQPKGVMLTHRNLLFVAAASAKIRSLTPDDRLYGVLPMSHAVGLSVVLLGTLISGATLYVVPRFDPLTARVSLERDALTIMLGVPSMFVQFLQYAKLRNLKKLQFPALRIISSSGAPLDPAVKTATEELFGLVLHNGFGITECSPNIAQTRIEAPRSDTSVGQVLPGVEINLIGPDGQAVADGEVGELWVRGPNIMKGYYLDPDETSAAINAEGWFNARDLARREDGNLFIVGRTKDLIVRHGFNVYPAEVEQVLNMHPAVALSAVIGRSVHGNEEIVAFVQLLPEASSTSADLEEYAVQYLAPYKRPSQIVIVSLMPTTATGKIAKAELKKNAEGSQFQAHVGTKVNG